MAATTSKWRFDVFLSFRGEDTRENFTRCLYEALDGEEIETFMDDESVQRGKLIFDEIKDAINKSRCAIIIFSRNYANSTWCLNELAWIMERCQNYGQKVIPVFLTGADPSDVRELKGNIGEPFGLLKRDYGPEMVDRWRSSLTLAGQLAGRTLHGVGNEKKLVEIVVKDVLMLLNVLPKKEREVKNSPSEKSLKAPQQYPIGLDAKAIASSAKSACPSTGIRINEPKQSFDKSKTYPIRQQQGQLVVREDSHDRNEKKLQNSLGKMSLNAHKHLIGVDPKAPKKIEAKATSNSANRAIPKAPKNKEAKAKSNSANRAIPSTSIKTSVPKQSYYKSKTNCMGLQGQLIKAEEKQKYQNVPKRSYHGGQVYDSSDDSSSTSYSSSSSDDSSD
ncbi:uncharacterized protein LOC122086706 [Macadamia integrifolia]|uniref:uncharacterized protein LOC122086706 n=1 Tax=Macadamia integrifolia TaxID=60698 RepID=UPI001C4E9938|nr:uncharacterized protein LOC122086706 [Macadamia integrifolia]